MVMDFKKSFIALFVSILLVIPFVLLLNLVGANSSSVYIVFLMVLYFISIKQRSPGSGKESVLGSITGLFIPFIPVATEHFNLPHYCVYISIAIAILLILLFIMGKFPLFINPLTIILVLILFRPIHTYYNYIGYFITLGVGIVYFTLIYQLLNKLVLSKMAPPKEQ